MKYEMKPEFLTGTEFIDTQHARLFEIANETYELMINEFTPDKYDYILNLLGELKNYTQYHFADEEAYMESIHYKRMFSQKVDHHNFIKKLEEMKPEYVDENQAQVIFDILEFLNNWLIEHILEKDILIGH